MTLTNTQSRCDCLFWLGLLLLVSTGCGSLAPGVSPLASDPPQTAFLLAHPGLTPVNYVDGELIPADDQSGDTYIARQYPRTYAAPPPPSAYTVPNNNPALGPQPPSVYQLPGGYQNPAMSAAAIQPQAQTYQPPQNNAVPLSGFPIPQSQPLPPPVNAAPPQIPGGSLPPPSLFGDTGLSVPVYSDPSYGAPVVGGQGLDSPAFGNLNDPYAGAQSETPIYIPNTRTADLEITGYPARTGRLMFGGAVNSDAGVTGQITVDERNFDITRWPTSFRDLASGTAFRGAGQTLRVEAVPGSIFKRYTASFAEPNLFDSPVSFGVSAFLYDRRFQDYNEERLGGRVSLGYRVTPELSLTTGLNGQNVEVTNPRVNTVSKLNEVVGNNQLFTGEFRLTHDTRNSPFQPSEGHFFEFGYEKAFGDFGYSRFEIENRNYLLLSERADGSGRQTVSFSTRLGFSGEDTPLFENYFAGGYATMRGFNFRGASPTEDGVQVGGRFQWLNTVEYMFPITADDAFRGVAFCDFGTVERDIEINKDDFRVAPGVGLRISIPMLGPAPLAFDFAYPVSMASTDQKRIFSFYMSALR